MKVNNVTEFLNFANSNGFTSLDASFSQLNQCLEKYKYKCSCYSNQDKINQYNECNRIYMNIVLSVLPRFKSIILSKVGDLYIHFYDGSRLIGVISR